MIHGNCIEKMRELEPNSVDAIVTDPPYGIGFMGKEWDTFKQETLEKTREYNRTKRKARPDGQKPSVSAFQASTTAGSYVVVSWHR